jgi:hypothetical protein
LTFSERHQPDLAHDSRRLRAKLAVAGGIRAG